MKGTGQFVEPYWTTSVSQNRGTPKKTDRLLPRVLKRLEILRNAYISAAGHTRPGVPQGLPIDEAITEANRLTALIRSAK